jgi:DNA-binding transcriptional LysR family regulator
MADLLVFAKIVEQGSFTQAASSLGLAKSQITKQLKRLETELAVTLLHRTTRRMSLTEAGASLFVHADAMARAAGAALDTAAQHGQQPSGRLRVSSSVTYGRHVLSSLLPGFHRQHPAVEVELLLVDRYVDLLEEGLDLAVRLTASPPSSLAGRPLHGIRFVVCGTPHFLLQHPVAHPAQLSAVPCMSFTAHARRNGATWQFARGRERISVDVKGPVVVNSSDVVRELVLSDMGLGLLPEFVVERDLEIGLLAPVLDDWQPSGSFGPSVWALWQPQRSLPPRVRVFVDYLVDQLGPTANEPSQATAARRA